jgi:threonine/homoserine/homoserine lactone efflux protein
MFLAMMSPGPDFILILKNGRFGIRTGLATSLGITIGFSLHTLLVIFGFSFILIQYSFLKHAVSFLGASYLFYLGIKIWNSYKEELNLDIKERQSWPQSLKEGFLCNILNPKVLLFILSLFTQFVPDNMTLDHKLNVALILIFECMVVWSLIGICLQYRPIKKILIDKRKYIDRLFSLAIILFSCNIFYNIIQKIE